MLLTLLMLALAGRAVCCAQIVPYPPPETHLTNRTTLDLDLDQQVDFELSEARHTRYALDLGFGWTAVTSLNLEIVPLAGNQVLVDSAEVVALLGRGEVIDETMAGLHWTANRRQLLNRPFLVGKVAFGPLAFKVLAESFEKHYIAVRLGGTQAPRFGWLAFANVQPDPYNWGYSRQNGAPVVAGDPDSGPPVTLAISLSPRSPRHACIAWEPHLAGLVLEESILGRDEARTAFELDPVTQTACFELDPWVGATHIFRARLTP